MSDGLFNPEAFEQMPGQMSMEQVEPTFSVKKVRTFDVWYELYDRMGYKITRASRTVRARNVDDAEAEVFRSAHDRFLHPVVIFVQELER